MDKNYSSAHEANREKGAKTRWKVYKATGFKKKKTAGEIARKLGYTTGRVHHALKGLKEEGLVEDEIFVKEALAMRLWSQVPESNLDAEKVGVGVPVEAL